VSTFDLSRFTGKKPIKATRRFVLGISGGHHESEAVALDLTTMQCTRATSDPFNIHRLERDAIFRIEHLMNKLALECRLSDWVALKNLSGAWMFSLPGAWRVPDRSNAVTIINASQWRREVDYVIDDTLAGLFVETADFCGVCAFAGTGASVARAVARPGETDVSKVKVFKVDGWGPVIGDYGSSFGIAANYFRHLRRVLDRNRECPYFPSILSACPEIKSYEYVQQWFDEKLVGGDLEWPVRFAWIAKTITTIADSEADDQSPATRLVHLAASEIAESIRIAVEQVEGKDIPLVLQGGLFRFSKKFRDRVITLIADLPVHVVLARQSPACGALLLALRDEPEILRRVHNMWGQNRNRNA
jgi:N-acetylglucosamine kinase-like BadF-type ATPase